MQRSPFDILYADAERAFTHKSLDLATEKGLKALQLAQRGGLNEAKSKAYCLLGRIASARGRLEGRREQFDDAVTYLLDALQLVPANAVALFCLAEVEAELGQHEAAAETLLAGVAVCVESNDSLGIVQGKVVESKLYMLQTEFQVAQLVAEEAEMLLRNQAVESDEVLAEVLHQLILVHLKRQTYHSLPEFCQPLIELSLQLGDIEKEITALNALAVLYGSRSDYKTAMQYFLEALEKGEAVHMRTSSAHSLINIGTIYALLFNYEDSLERYRRIINDFSDVLSTPNLVVVYNNIGNIYYYKKLYHDARNYYRDAIELAEKSHYQEMYCLSKVQICKVYLALGEQHLARELAKELSLNCFQGNVSMAGNQIHNINLAQIALLDGDFNLALRNALRSLRHARQNADAASEIEAYKLLGQIYEMKNDHRMALKCLRIHTQRKAQFQQNKRQLQIIDLEIRYDIREEKRKIEQLTRENEYQAILIGQSSQIEKQNIQLLQVNEELRQFAYAASHDLKEPLRMIGSFTQLIQRECKDKVSEDTKTFFGYVSEGVNRMNNLLDALLRYSTIGQNEHTLTYVSTGQIIEMCRANLRILIDETNTNLIVTSMPQIKSVESLLMQLFQNLISNAIKFRKPEAQCTIHISAEREGQEWVFTVRDNGIGIDPEHHERIFIIFQRLHTRVKYEGAGIGLAICHKIVHQLGGRIWVNSKINEGCSFHFTLPTT